MNYPTLIIPIAVVAALFWFFTRYWKLTYSTPGSTQWIKEYDRPALSFSGRRYPMQRGDILPVMIITVVYAAVAFFGLGDMDAPESFYRFSDTAPAIIDLGEERAISSILYYTGLWKGEYTLETSVDGEAWVEQTRKTQLEDETWTEEPAMPQETAHLFKWRTAELNSVAEKARYLRLTPSTAPMELGELGIYDTSGKLIDSTAFRLDDITSRFFDEQEVVPESASYLNSMYFDEIYHGRTAYEHELNVYPYEISHPPLGKIIIWLGIKLFGMVPFGWRFMGTLFGVLMVPLFYALIKNIFGKTAVAVCGTVIFAFDFMHYVQTRIATIDTYAVFFIILMYLFMYRFITADYEEPFKKAWLPLFLSGLFFGLGAASKWTCIYAGAGLAVIYTISLVLRGRWCSQNGRSREFKRFLISTLALSLLAFIVIPAFIYYVSYIPYAWARGYDLFSAEQLKLVWDNQVFMFTYHSGVNEAHNYESRWWMWIVNARPILYYRDISVEGVKSAFAAFLNPVVCWGGLLAVITMPVLAVRQKDSKALFIFLGWLAQLLPWVFISRTTFAYHYFPSMVFLVLALCHVFDLLIKRAGKKLVYGFTAGCTALFGMFYPVLSGITVPTWYTYNVLKWFPSWPF